MNINQELDSIRQSVLRLQLGESLTQLENYLYTYPHHREKERLDGIMSDYELMCDYWRKGFNDPARADVYRQLLCRLYSLVNDIDMRYRIRNTSFVMSVYSRTRNSRKDWSLSALRQDLESYVSETTMLSLLPENERAERSLKLNQQHQLLMRDLFDYIWTSRSWSDSLADAFEGILLSPTVDSIDQQLIVSAIMLSAMNLFDFNKFRVMAHVYQQAADERLRQRALVGWALTLNAEAARQLFTEERQLVEELVADERCRQELGELQMQLVYCTRAESDGQRIQQEIMPDLMKGNMFRVTRNGIEEVEEDPMEDILHPEETEQRMERMEASFRKMIDMQRSGSDIYFGGFAQMKRFPFFNDISNWFVPFYIDHPDIAQAVKTSNNNAFLRLALQKGPFCNSDKYSFTLAFTQVINHLPENLRELVARGEMAINEVETEELHSPAYIRRIYLQDLYRFFRLYPQRSEFRNPFDSTDSQQTLLANPLFKGTLIDKSFSSIAAFLVKQQMPSAALEVLNNVSDPTNDFNYYIQTGNLLLQSDTATLPTVMSSMSAVMAFEQALRLQPDSERALQGLARAYFYYHRYDEALKAYDRLLALRPDKKNFLLNKAVCLTNLGDYEEALKLLYRLDYENADDQNVRRVLAWALTCHGKYEQAVKIYNKLLPADHPVTDDLLNYGYCLWFSGDVTSAIGMFRQYVSDSDADLDMSKEFMTNEHRLLASHGIGDIEIRLMLDALR
jgi:tetratricopeptide (TPR) repeat protein